VGFARYVDANPETSRGKTWRLQRFAAGWALGMWRLCIEDDEANRTVVNLVRKEYTIGRAEENAVRLTERNVSRRHATLRRTGDQWMLEDLKSETGSYVNERRVDEPLSVEHRDKVRIGDYDITLLDSEKEAEEAAVDKQNETIPASVESDRSGDRHDRLVVVEGPNPGTQYPLLDKKLLVGRGEECDLTLPDTSVSRVHASLMRDEHGRFHISDQKSSNGVRVNGMEITKIPLYAGDIVELGDVHLQFVPKGSRFDESALRPATSARSVPAKSQAGGKLWVGLGLLGIVGGVIWFGSQRNRAEAPEALEAAPTTSVEDSLLTQAGALLQANDSDGALTLLKSVPLTSPQRTGARFQSLAEAWAGLQFRKVEVATTPAEQRVLLMQVVGFEDVGETHLNTARDQLRALATATADGGAASGAASAVDPNSLPPAPTAAHPSTVAAVPKPAVVAARPAPRPAVVPASPKPAPAPVPPPNPSAVSVNPPTTPAPTPNPAPPPQTAQAPAPQPPAPQPPAPQAAPQAPAPQPPAPQAAPQAPAPSPIAPKPAPVPAPAVPPSPAQAAPSPAPAPPVNSPPVLNWPGAAP
jgi:ABC transport system ATP-binding/permease protein